jgi:8-amino-3,8-dideoxy-alpha-D-manno-octulosonate transaminase
VATATALAVEGGRPVRSTALVAGRGGGLLGAEEREAVLRVLDSRSLFRYYGPALQHRAEAFEAAVCRVLGTQHAVATSSGTAALRTALAALGVGCGDEVIVPAFTFVATVNAVVACGAVPVFAEVDDSLGLDAAGLEACISDRTAAIIPVHLENVACDMDALLAVARRRGVRVLEDAAQAIGATYRGRSLGTLGDLGAYSLQLEKNITTGEGGVLVTSDPALHLRAARYQDQGGQFETGRGGRRGDELVEPFAGENLRITEIAAAIAEVQLGRLPGVVAMMRQNKQRIVAALGEVAGLVRRRRHDPDGDGGSSITWFAPDPRVARALVAALGAEGIPAVQMYGGLPVYATPSILRQRTASMKGGPWHCAEHPPRVSYAMGMCPRTEALVARSFTVGVGAQWSVQDCDDVAAAVVKVASRML